LMSLFVYILQFLGSKKWWWRQPDI
jgi:hypothetical protein